MPPDRLIPTVESSMSGRTAAAVLAHLVESVPMPETRRASS